MIDLPGFHAFLYALVFCLGIPLLHISLIHIVRKSAWTVRLLFISLLINFVTWCVTANGSRSDLVTGGCTILFFFLFYMEFFSMVARGFSLNIVRTIDENSHVTRDNVLALYAGGQGISWLFEKRIKGLKGVGFISTTSEHVTLITFVGIGFAHFCNAFKRCLKMGKGG